jgi:hypothetical protein
MIRGMMYQDIAAKLKCSTATISNEVQAIFDQWAAEDAITTKQRIAFRVKQLELAAWEALEGFERSKQNAETIRKEFERQPCKTCKGGTNPPKGKAKCGTCGGTGEILVENITKSTTGQSGDPAFLKTYIEAVREAGRVQGLYAYIKAKYSHRKKPRQVYETHIHADVDWSRVPSEQLLQVKYACAKAIESSSTAIDVLSTQLEEKENV